MAVRQGQTFRHLREVTTGNAPDGARIREVAGRSTGLEGHSLALIAHPAGTSSASHRHAVAEEVYYVQSGQGRIRVDQEERKLEPGSIVQIHAGQHHKLWSDGPGDLLLVVTCAPAYTVDDVAWDE